MTKQDHERAKELGRQAARAGKMPNVNPYRNSSALRDLSLAWLTGYQEGKR